MICDKKIDDFLLTFSIFYQNILKKVIARIAITFSSSLHKRHKYYLLETFAV